MSAFVGSVAVLGDVKCHEHEEILSPDAVQFLGELHVLFNNRRKDLLHARTRRRVTGTLDNNAFVAAADVLAGKPSPTPAPAGAMRLDFLPETAHIRADKSWRVASIPSDLLDRHVEITGPVDRKMVINALNSGARVFMADFEDSHAPTWQGNLAGQVNLRDAIRGTISLESGGKTYALRAGARLATLMVRPRGWHLPENHIIVNSEPMSGSLFDFGLFFYHNAHALLAKGSGPYFYLPKMESYLEARLWNDVFAYAQHRLGIRYGTVRATCLIETLPAAFQMDEILYELRHHSAGLNCGRWDYIFSAIKTLGAPTGSTAAGRAAAAPAFVLPDRQEVTMTVPWMAAYVRLLIHTCHKRGAHAMGGMSAQIPIKDDATANDAALAKVRADKEREVTAGHDGTWVAHPALIPVAREVFKRHMREANQIPTEVLGVARVGNLDPVSAVGLADSDDATVAPESTASTSRLAGVFGVAVTSPAAEGALKSLEETLVCAGDRAAGPSGVVTAVAAALASPANGAKGPSASPSSLFARGNARPLGRFADASADVGNGAYGAVDASVGRFAAAPAGGAAGGHTALAPEGDWEDRARRRGADLFGSTDWDETRLGQPPSITARDLTTPNTGNITLSGVRTSVSVAVQYVEAFLRGVGCIPLFNMMEDAATAEICRVQLWQYTRFGVTTACGTQVTPTLIRAIVKEHSDSIRATLGDDKYWKSKYALAHDILLESLLRPTLDDFITSKCYPYICTITQGIAKL